MAKTIDFTLKAGRLSQALNHQFTRPELLEQALSHRSIANQLNNERLEFLGDALLNIIIATALFDLYPKAREGELTRMRARLVREETLAELAREFCLPKFIKLGPGELRSGGHQRDSIIADAMEAIIAAIYLDSDLETCRACVLDWFKIRLKSLSKGVDKDAKTQLQELRQAEQLPLPTYLLVEQTGNAMAQQFIVNCHISDSLSILGEGPSRRKAEQQAAANMLAILKAKS